MTESSYVCEVEGCTANARDGVTIHRTSPKPGPFRGRCEAHLDHTPDEDVLLVTDTIEFDNMRRKEQRG